LPQAILAEAGIGGGVGCAGGDGEAAGEAGAAAAEEGGAGAGGGKGVVADANARGGGADGGLGGYQGYLLGGAVVVKGDGGVLFVDLEDFDVVLALALGEHVGVLFGGLAVFGGEVDFVEGVELAKDGGDAVGGDFGGRVGRDDVGVDGGRRGQEAEDVAGDDAGVGPGGGLGFVGPERAGEGRGGGQGEAEGADDVHSVSISTEREKHQRANFVAGERHFTKGREGREAGKDR